MDAKTIELPPLDITEMDRSYYPDTRELTRVEAQASFAQMVVHVACRERQLLEYARDLFDAREALRHATGNEARLLKEVQELQCQLAGCGVAAEGWGMSMDNGPAVQGDYGWSPAYESVMKLRYKSWRCFHCDFFTLDEKEAEAHFGERDDPEEFKPLCKWWQRMDEGERASALQDFIQQLTQERDDNAGNMERLEESGNALRAIRDALPIVEGDYLLLASAMRQMAKEALLSRHPSPSVPTKEAQ